MSSQSKLWSTAISMGLAGAVLINVSAKATETIELTAIDGYPPKALWVKEFINFFIPEIDKRLAKTGDYKIKWNQAWSGQIVKPKHVLEGIQKGLGDIGVVTTVFHADKVPLQMVAYATPFVTTDPGLVARTVDELANRFPEYRAAWKKYNQVYLTNLAVLDSYQILSKEPILTLADFKGTKVAGAGMNLRWLQGFGAAGVGGSLVGYYNKLKTGVVDSAMIWADATMQFKVYEVAPHMLRANLGTVNSKAITMNADSWKKLPREVQIIIQDSAIAYRDHVGEQALIKSAGNYKKYVGKGGTITVMSAAERQKWANTMPNVAKDWVASLEKKGIPGKEVLAMYMDIMRKAEQPILRQWDKE